MTPFRVLVCGGRHFNNVDPIIKRLEALYAEHGDNLIVIHGDYNGADRNADWVARDHLHGAVARVPANWDYYGPSAGPKRNRWMLLLEPHLVLAYPTAQSKGTWHMVGLAERADIPVEVHEH